MEKPNKTAENLGVVRVNNDQIPAELIRERDPEGKTIVHAVRRSAYVHERLYAGKKIEGELFEAAEKFRHDFEKAQLLGNYTRLDLMKTRAGKHEISDGVANAKFKISKALRALGTGKNGEASLAQSCAWNVIGLGATLESWTHLIRLSGGMMNADKAAGVLHVVMQRLALEYGLIDVGKMTAIESDQAYGRGVRDVGEFTRIYATATGADPASKEIFNAFLSAFRKRFNKFT